MSLRASFQQFWEDEHGAPPPYQWAICGTCRGEGVAATRTLREHAFTQAEREEMGEEWFEFIDDYRAGVYNDVCDGCGGSGKVKEFSGEAAREFQDWEREAAADAATMRAESGYAW